MYRYLRRLLTQGKKKKEKEKDCNVQIFTTTFCNIFWYVQIFPGYVLQACRYSLEHRIPLIAFSKDRCLTLFEHPVVDTLHTVYQEPKVPNTLIILSSHIIVSYLCFNLNNFAGGGHAFYWASLGCFWNTGMAAVSVSNSV